MTSAGVVRPAPPRPVATAVKCLYAMAALSVIGIVLSLTVGLPRVRSAAVGAAGTLDSGTVSAITLAAVVVGVVVGLIAAALYVLAAVFVGRGRNWARVLAFVLAGLTVLSGLSALFRPSASGIAGIVQLVLAIVVVVMLVKPESSAYFASGTGRGQPEDPGYPPLR